MSAIDWRTARVAVTGDAGFLGTAVCRALRARGVDELLVPRSARYDFTKESAVRDFYRDMRPDVVLHLAAEGGGIGANRARPGRFFYVNLAMGLHLIEHARRNRVSKFVQVGTVCAYPKLAPVPFVEEDLWNGYPDESNAPYGLAKKALLTQIQAYREQYGFPGIYLLPVNLYGPGDSFDLETSHVIPALIRKFCAARNARAPSVEVWGSGTASRDFLYVDDCAAGLVAAAETYDSGLPVNLGTGTETSIADLAQKIRQLTGFGGDIRFDRGRPDGQPRRCLDTSKAERLFGFKARIDLDTGLRKTIEWWETASARRG